MPRSLSGSHGHRVPYGLREGEVGMAGGLAEFTDGALVERHLVGQLDGFDALYRRFWPRLSLFCERLTGDRAAAEDVAQETLLRAFGHLGRFDIGRPMWPWLKAIAANVAVDHTRSRVAEAAWPEEEALTLGDDDALLEERQLLASALSRLPARQRIALGLRYVHDWSAAEAADFLGLSRPAFEQLLFRGRQRLRAEYERAGRGLGDRLGVLAAPFLLAARRVRLVLHRRHAAASDALAAAWARVDPMSAINAVVCSSVACHVAVATFAGLTVVGVGGAGQPSSADPITSVAWVAPEVASRLVPQVTAWPRAGGRSAEERSGGDDADTGRGSSESRSNLPEAGIDQQQPISDPQPWGTDGKWRYYNVQSPVIPVADPDGDGPEEESDVYAGMGFPCTDGKEGDLTLEVMCENVFEPENDR